MSLSPSTQSPQPTPQPQPQQQNRTPVITSTQIGAGTTCSSNNSPLSSIADGGLFMMDPTSPSLSPGSMPSVATPSPLPGTSSRLVHPQRGNNLKKEAVVVLKSWLFEHFEHPYPSDAEKLQLARRANLSITQVNNWFINARRRIWRPAQKSHLGGSATTHATANSTITGVVPDLGGSTTVSDTLTGTSSQQLQLQQQGGDSSGGDATHIIGSTGSGSGVGNATTGVTNIADLAGALSTSSKTSKAAALALRHLLSVVGPSSSIGTVAKSAVVASAGGGNSGARGMEIDDGSRAALFNLENEQDCQRLEQAKARLRNENVFLASEFTRLSAHFEMLYNQLSGHNDYLVSQLHDLNSSFDQLRRHNRTLSQHLLGLQGLQSANSLRSISASHHASTSTTTADAISADSAATFSEPRGFILTHPT